MRGDANREPEGEDAARDDWRSGRRRDRGAEQRVREEPERVRRMQERPVVAPATGPERVERGAERGGRYPRSLRRAHHDAATEAHPPDTQVAEPRLPPVPLDLILRMPAVEAFDARPEERADLAPLARHEPPRERQDSARGEPPERVRGPSRGRGFD